MKYILLFGMALYGNLLLANDWLQYVPDTVSVDEMKRNFMDWTQGRTSPAMNRVDRLYSMRWVYVYETDEGDPPYYYYLDSRCDSCLHREGRDTIPPSNWSLVARSADLLKAGDLWEMQLPKVFCWNSFRDPVPAGTDTLQLRNRLVNRYGLLPSFGVPARWVTGTFGIAQHTRLYCNNRVAGTVKLFRIEKGMVVSGQMLTLRGKPGSLGKDQEDLKPTSSFFNRYFGDIELKFLARDLRRVQTPDTTYDGLKDFVFLVYVDVRGKARLHLLLPEKPTQAEQRLLKRLYAAFDRQPSGIFGHFVTPDGRIFPGRYIHGRYIRETDDWFFSDYLFQKKFNRPEGR